MDNHEQLGGPIGDPNTHPAILAIPDEISVGTTVNATVMMNGACTSDVVVSVGSTNAAALSVPTSVTVRKGANSATFGCTALAVSGGVTVVCTANGGAATSTVIIV